MASSTTKSSSPTSYDILEKSTLPIKSNNNNNNNKKSNYGSLRKDLSINQQQQIVNIKHKLINGETLQGLSLKYSVPIENIKRANKMWTNTIEVYREYLTIPIEKDKLNEIEVLNNINNNNNNVQTNNNNNNNENDNNKNTQTNYKDYLSKYDAIINESKLKLKNLESTSSVNNSTSYSSEINDISNDDFLFKNTPKLNRSDNERKYSYLYTNEDLIQTPDFIIKQSNSNNNNNNNNNNNVNNMNNTLINNQRAKHAYETLQKLEIEKDYLFEL